MTVIESEKVQRGVTRMVRTGFHRRIKSMRSFCLAGGEAIMEVKGIESEMEKVNKERFLTFRLGRPSEAKNGLKMNIECFFHLKHFKCAVHCRGVLWKLKHKL